MSSFAPYPEFIKSLPKADLPMAGMTAHLMAAPTGQVVFFELPAEASVPPHSHGAQWGIVVSGKVELTIGGETKTYQPGDSYFIGDGVEHAANVFEDSLVIDVFADPNRYTAQG
ncbi:MAG: cupin domain-containing protein [Desulfarculaceae bacterium]|nr:cupin domain-containing protein [Desulfarculaceae bacterium]